jgi:hypothetical protein
MPHRIAEQLRQAAAKCEQLARDSKDRDIAIELQRVGRDLAEKAKRLDNLFTVIDTAE